MRNCGRASDAQQRRPAGEDQGVAKRIKLETPATNGQSTGAQAQAQQPQPQAQLPTQQQPLQQQQQPAAAPQVCLQGTPCVNLLTSARARPRHPMLGLHTGVPTQKAQRLSRRRCR